MSIPNEGFIHWSMPDLIWTGDAFQLQLSTTDSAYATNWLNVHLAERLTAVLGYDVAVEATPAYAAALSDSIAVRRGLEEFGVIAIHPLREPLPEPEAIYNVISIAVAEAHERAERAEAVAADYVSRLATCGSQEQVTS